MCHKDIYIRPLLCCVRDRPYECPTDTRHISSRRVQADPWVQANPLVPLEDLGLYLFPDN